MNCFKLDPNNAIDWSHPLNHKRVGLWLLVPEKESNVLFDLSTNRNRGTVVGSPTRTIMSVGSRFKAINFNGTSDWYEITNNNFDGTSSYSLSQWVKTSTTSFRLSLSFGNFSASDGVYIGYNNGVTGAVTGSVIFTTAVNNNIYTSNVSINNNTWRHVCCTKNGQNVAIYVDGYLITSGTLAGAASSATYQRIGNWRGGTSFCFPGQIASTSVWTRALSASEVWQEYCASKLDYLVPNSPLRWAPLDNEEWMEEVASTGPVMPIFRHHYRNQGIL